MDYRSFQVVEEKSLLLLSAAEEAAEEELGHAARYAPDKLVKGISRKVVN